MILNNLEIINKIKREDSEKENLKEYIKKNIGNIIDIIVNGIKKNALDKVFIIQKFVEE